MKNAIRTLTVGSLIALGGGAFLGLGANDSRAQSACFTQCMSNNWGEGKCKSYCYGDEPQVYGYSPPSSSAPGRVVRQPRRVITCGEFHYWDGTSCVDARGRSGED